MKRHGKKFRVIFTDGTEKELTGEDVTIIYLRALSFLLTLHKEVRVENIVDEAAGKIDSDFEWDLSFSEKDKTFTTGTPKLYPREAMENLLFEYVKHIGGSKSFAENWLKRLI